MNLKMSIMFTVNIRVPFAAVSIFSIFERAYENADVARTEDGAHTCKRPDK